MNKRQQLQYIVNNVPEWPDIAELEFLHVDYLGNIIGNLGTGGQVTVFHSPDPEEYSEPFLPHTFTREEYEKAKAAKKPLKAGRMKAAKSKRPVWNDHCYIITSAQNNTEVHQAFLQSLLVYAEHLEAKLLVGQFVYNKNGFQSGVHDSDDIYFAECLKPYFLTEEVEIAPRLVYCGHVNILPTTKYPLSGFEQFTEGASTILPASKIALESVATSKGIPAKMLYSTGTVTLRNYIPKKSGQLADAGHNYGALIVEVSDTGQWFVRQLETDESGCFYDLDLYVTPDGIEDAPEAVKAINWGDLHCEKSDEAVLDCCFRMVDYLKPENQIFHDVFDFMTNNHHNRDNVHHRAAMIAAGNSVLEDIKITDMILSCFASFGGQCYIVESNHDLALERWLSDSRYDWRTDTIENAILYLELQAWLMRAISHRRAPHILEHALREYGGAFAEYSPKFLITDESLVLAGVEMGFHGHNGINGARGNPKQFQKLAMPINTGHTHSASIHGAVYTAGVTGSLDMGYNQGPSSWSHSHILTYKNGKRCIITMQRDDNGEWQWHV